MREVIPAASYENAASLISKKLKKGGSIFYDQFSKSNVRYYPQRTMHPGLSPGQQKRLDGGILHTQSRCIRLISLLIEPETIASKEPTDYSDADLIHILRPLKVSKYNSQRSQVLASRMTEQKRVIVERRIEKIDRCLAMMRE